MPEGVPNPHNLVCLLSKSIYGLKQASREWHAKLVEELLYQGFRQSKNNYGLFLKKQNYLICVVVYVDDVILTGSDTQAIESLKSHLDAKFGIKELGVLHYFLGIEVTSAPYDLVLCQQKFAKELLLESRMNISPPVCTHFPIHLKLSLIEGDLLRNPELFRSMVSKLNYLANTRTDLSLYGKNARSIHAFSSY